jgi:hypothetical protein
MRATPPVRLRATPATISPAASGCDEVRRATAATAPMDWERTVQAPPQLALPVPEGRAPLDVGHEQA